MSEDSDPADYTDVELELPTETVAKLNELSEKMGLSIDEIVEKAMDDYIKNHDEFSNGHRS